MLAPIVFLAHTEYHLMNSVNISMTSFKDRDAHIFYTDGRINIDTQTIGETISFHRIKTGSNYKDIYRKIKSLKPEVFFSFQEGSLLDFYLYNKLKKSKVKIVLAQDGMKPYAVWYKKHRLLSIIKDTVITYTRLLRKGIVLFPIEVVNLYQYGSSKKINELWLTNPENYAGSADKCIKKIPQITKDVFLVLCGLFHFDAKDFSNYDVMIFGRPFIGNEIKEDYSILTHIAGIYRGKRILYKIHPNQSKEHIMAIESIKGIEVRQIKIPGELLILSMKNGVIISYNSTASLTFNEGCKYYWLHKLYKIKINEVSKQSKAINPTDYIVEVQEIDEIR